MATLEHELGHNEKYEEFSASAYLIHPQNSCHSGQTFIPTEVLKNHFLVRLHSVKPPKMKALKCRTLGIGK